MRAPARRERRYHPGVPNEEAVTRADIEFHAATAHLYEETLAPVFRAHHALITAPVHAKLERMAPGREALDIGCGTGVNALRLAERGFSVRGIDHSPEMLAIADAKVRDRGLGERVELQTGDDRALPFDDASFDLVMCTGVLHHLASVDRCVAEADRVLRPGGVLMVIEPCVGSNPPLRAWDALRRMRQLVRERVPAWRRQSRPRVVAQPAVPAEPLEVPDHDEGPIDAGELIKVLDELGMDREIEYWSFFDGLHHRGPLWLQKAIVLLGSRPWRRSGGNMIVLLARSG